MDVRWTCEPAGCSLFKLRVSMVFFRLPALARARPLLFFMLACGLTAARADISAQSLPGRPANLVTVQLAREGDVSIVTLEADGPLPEPTFGVAHDPFRFYVDFPNVAPESRGVLNSTDPLVLRVRVATYSIEPLISRVVLDLKRELPIRVDTDGRGAGRIRILVGMHKVMTAAKGTTPAQASVPPVPSLPASPPPPVTTSPTPTVQAPPPPKPTTPAPRRSRRIHRSSRRVHRRSHRRTSPCNQRRPRLRRRLPRIRYRHRRFRHHLRPSRHRPCKRRPSRRYRLRKRRLCRRRRLIRQRRHRRSPAIRRHRYQEALRGRRLPRRDSIRSQHRRPGQRRNRSVVMTVIARRSTHRWISCAGCARCWHRSIC